MLKYEIPLFLRGSFAWSMHGFFHAQPFTANLLEPSWLKSENPWIVIAAAVEHAKHGDHTYIRRLQRWFYAGKDGFPDQTCICVTGSAGTEADLHELLPLMKQGPDPLRAYACQAASMAGRLWLIPFMLEAYERTEVPGERETIGFAIADLLDEEFGGPVANEVGSCQIDAGLARQINNPQLRELALGNADQCHIQ